MPSGVSAAPQSPPASAEAIARVGGYVRALRRRATALYAIRALSASVGASAAGLLATAALSGPIITPVASQAVVALLLLTFVGCSVWLLWPARRLSGLGSCDLLEPVAPALASRVRTTLELEAADGVQSPALVAAHARQVSSEVAAIPVHRVVPYGWLRHPSVIVGLLTLAVSALSFGLDDGLRGGAHALFHPAQVRGDGVRVAPVVAGVHARLIYPSYLGMPPAEQADAKLLEVPRGTTVELTVSPRLSSRHGVLAVGESQVRLRPVPDGGLFARFVARESASLDVSLESDGAWYQDTTERALRAVAARPPKVRLLSPADGSIVEADAPMRVRFSAEDDHGLSTVELAVRLADGEQQRRRLWSSVSSDGPRKALDDATIISPAELGGQPGDVLVVWIEASDADVVAGPNVGLSESATIEVASDAQKFSMHIPRMQELLDGALDVLADRLETGLPSEPAHARQRMQELHAGVAPWLERLSQLIGDAEHAAEELPIDVDQLSGILRRTRRELRRESSAYRGSGNHPKRWRDVDRRVTEEHEKDVLLLADTLAQALVDEARVLTDELNQLKSEIGELLQRYKEEQSPEAKRALLAEIAKAQRRLRELAESLSRLSKRVPSEFINREAMPQKNARGNLEDLKAAIESGDMDSAEEFSAALAAQIDDLTEHIDSGGARFRESRFGQRDRAMSEARHRVDMLAEEQQRLAGRSRDVVQRATERAQRQDAPSSQTERLRDLAQEVEQQLEALGGGNLGTHERRMLGRAKSRVRDTRDALSTGDMAEANRMSSAAKRSLDQASNSLQQDAQMFPGHQGEPSDAARAAAEASDRLGELQRRIQEQTPGLGEHVNDGERRQMRGDAPAQRDARKLAEQLGEQLGTGPEGTPLSPQGERSIRDATEAMKEAERALERGNPQDAALAQEEATERLQQAQEWMRRGRGERSGSDDGQDGQGRRRSGDGRGKVDGPVRIPGADEHTGPVEMRRRLLDAMKEPTASGFESAVERYYQELLQ